MTCSISPFRFGAALGTAFALSCGLGFSQAALTAYYDFEPDGDPYDDPAGAFADNLVGLYNPALTSEVTANAKGSTQCASFNGNSVLYTSAYTTDLGPDPDSYTIMFWIKGTDANQENNNIRLISTRRLPGGGDSTQPSWQIEGFGNNGSNGTAMDLRIAGLFTPDARSGPIGALANNGQEEVWHHVAYIVSNSGHPVTGNAYTQTYFDGVSVGVEQETNFDPMLPVGNINGQLIIGGDAENAGTRAFTGLLDDIALFAGVVDANAIAQIAAGVLSPNEIGSATTLSLTSPQAFLVEFNLAEVEVQLNEDVDELIVVWDTTDHGTEALGDWPNSQSEGAAAAGSALATLSGLSEHTTYFVRFFASQTSPAASSWSAGFSFMTPFENPPPLLEKVNVTSLAAVTATATAPLAQGDADTVTLVWAFADQGESNIDAWVAAPGGGSADLGAALVDDLLIGTLSGLNPGTEYAYRFLATNAFGSDWSEPGHLVSLRDVPVLTAYYDFEGSGDDRFDDPAGEYQDDLIGQYNAAFSGDTPGFFAGTQSASFNGDVVLFTDAYSPDLGPDPNAFTIMFWIKGTDANQELDNTRLISTRLKPDGSGSTPPAWQIEGFGNNGSNGTAMDLRMPGLFTPDARNGEVGALANTGQNEEWHHVAFILANGGHPDTGGAYSQTYFDGVSVGIETETAYDPFLLMGNADGQLILGGDNESAGTRAFTGLLDDVALFAGIVDADEIAAIAAGSKSPASYLGFIPGLMLDVNSAGDDLVFTWASTPGRAYTLRSNPDLESPRLTWTPIQTDLVATPPLNTLTIPRPAAGIMFYAIEAHAPPPLFADDFESDLGWTTGVDGDPATAWERGAPVAVGPAAAKSPVNCYGTNIGADYGINADAWLRSPPIDLTTAGLTSATLSFHQFKDFESLPYEEATVAFLDDSDGALLAPAVFIGVNPTLLWSENTMPLPAAAIGKTVRIEFRFKSDTEFELAGWYIDDVEVHAQ